MTNKSVLPKAKVVKDPIYRPRWTLPFPWEELDTRIMCGDPVATAYQAIEKWLDQQSFKPPVTMVELLDCLWHRRYRTSPVSYEIVRGDKSLPSDMPDDVYNRIEDLFS